MSGQLIPLDFFVAGEFHVIPEGLQFFLRVNSAFGPVNTVAKSDFGTSCRVLESRGLSFSDMWDGPNPVSREGLIFVDEFVIAINGDPFGY